MIIDLSPPHNNKKHVSINDLIDKDQCSLTYVKLDDAIRKICEIGQSAILSKYDLKDAFKICPTRKSQWHLYCVRWEGLVYVLVRLSFGCRSSPIIFDTLARSICWIVENCYNVNFIMHLLDDFQCIDRPDYDASITHESMLDLFDTLGIPLSNNKTVSLCTCLEYLGVILDTVKMEARLPNDKIMRIKAFINSFYRNGRPQNLNCCSY